MTTVTARFATPRGVPGQYIDVRFEVPPDMIEMPLDHPLPQLLETVGYMFMFYNYVE